MAPPVERVHHGLSTASLSLWMMDTMGGIFAARWLHRAVGIVFSVLVVAEVRPLRLSAEV